MLERLIRKTAVLFPRRVEGFDPEFYATYYADLLHLRSNWQLREHYIRHGKSEGRFKSQTEAVGGDFRSVLASYPTTSTQRNINRLTAT